MRRKSSELPAMSGQRESKPLSAFRVLTRFRRKLAAISALSALAENGRFARFAQNYAVRVSDFVRKQFCARATYQKRAV